MTDPLVGFYFSSAGDPVPGTGPYLSTDSIIPDGDLPQHAHSYAYGTQAVGVYMPQSRIRQRTLFDQEAPDGGHDLQYNYGAGCTLGDCVDLYRYWPAFRMDVGENSKINKFVINDNENINCKRWASKNTTSEKKSSDDGSFYQTTMGGTNTVDMEDIMLGVGSPGYIVSDSLDEGGNTLSFFEPAPGDGAGENTNYVNGFNTHYAPGWHLTCCKRAAVSFMGHSTAGGDYLTMEFWGAFHTRQNGADLSNLEYGTHYYKGSSRYPSADCRYHQTCGEIHWDSDYDYNSYKWYVGGHEKRGRRDKNAGERWKDPALEIGGEYYHWIEPDICAPTNEGALDSFSFDQIPGTVEGGFHSHNERLKKNFHCFQCDDGRKIDPTYDEAMDMDDRKEVCFSLCNVELASDEDDNISPGEDPVLDTYFISGGIFYNKQDYLYTWDGLDPLD